MLDRIFNRKYVKALELIRDDIEVYEAWQRRCDSLLVEADYADTLELEAWKRVYGQKKEALQVLLSELNQLVG